MPFDQIRSSRLKSLGWLLGLVSLVIFSRLFYLQVIRHDHYQALADSTHLAKFEIDAQRGEIYAFDGNQIIPIVMNQSRWRLYADPRFIDNWESTASKLAEVTGGNEQDYRQKLQRQTAYVVLEPRLETSMADAIRELKLKGVGLTEIATREYPEGNLAAQVLGFVNDEGDGQYGIEQSLNEILNGQPGLLSGAVDVRGIPIATAENVQEPAKNGSGVVLTIDRNLQAVAEQSLAASINRNRAENGSLLIVDTKTGDVKAMANSPTFNPAEFRSSDISTFSNPIVNLAYEPGSVIKAFIIAIGLDSGVITPDTKYLDTSTVEINNFTIRNSVMRPAAQRDMRDVMRLSLNTGSIFILERLGGNEINNQAKQAFYDFLVDKLDLDKKSNLEQTGLSTGLIDAPRGISDVRYANMTFGQGLSLTMARMAPAFAALVNGGNLLDLRLVHGTTDAKTGALTTTDDSKIIRQGVIKPETSTELVNMMRSVVEDGAGRIARRDGYIVGGKTGTAQKVDRERGGYHRDRIISSFFGFTGNDSQRYAILVRIDEPKVNIAGSTSSTQVFAEMSDWLIDYYALAPVK